MAPSLGIALLLGGIGFAPVVHAQSSRYDELANFPFQQNYPTEETAQRLKDELLFERGVAVVFVGLARHQHVDPRRAIETSSGSHCDQARATMRTLVVPMMALTREKPFVAPW